MCSGHQLFKSDKSLIHNYEILIFGISTWEMDKIHEDWEVYLKDFEKPRRAKIIAYFGLGDQNIYADTFVNALGLLYDRFEKYNLTVIGKWTTNGYHYNYSKAVKDNKFVGLVIDEEGQYKLTKDRVKLWVRQIKKELNTIYDNEKYVFGQ